MPIISLGWNALETALRAVPLRGDASLHPYQTAHINCRQMAIASLAPTAFYVLADQLDQHHNFGERLRSDLGRELFELDELLAYEQDGQNWRIAPVIIETAYDPSLGQSVSAIVDGLHRVWLAREQGRTMITVVEITEIPAQFPLVPLPLQWSDLSVVERVPANEQKRRFRFPTLSSFPDISAFSDAPVTDENYLYFFYRDLSLLGSGGVRSDHLRTSTESAS
jgi:hypothetical protein